MMCCSVKHRFILCYFLTGTVQASNLNCELVVPLEGGPSLLCCNKAAWNWQDVWHVLTNNQPGASIHTERANKHTHTNTTKCS